MADSSSRQTTRTSLSLRSRRSHSEPYVTRRTYSSDRASPYHNLATNVFAIARHHTVAQQWRWLPMVIANWRIEEDIEPSADVGEPFYMNLSPYTQEPSHCTVPVLAARLHRHERRLRDIELEQNETRTNWIHMAERTITQIYQDQEEINESNEIIHDQLIGNKNEISVIQTRLEQCETRLRETEDYSRSLEQRLTMAEETLRMVGRLTETIERVITLLPPP